MALQKKASGRLHLAGCMLLSDSWRHCRCWRIGWQGVGKRGLREEWVFLFRNRLSGRAGRTFPSPRESLEELLAANVRTADFAHSWSGHLSGQTMHHAKAQG